MTKTIFRIDDRLIHGQVIEGWVHNLNLTRIVIASDRISEDLNYKQLLEFSVLPEINVEILKLKELAFRMKSGYLEEEDTIVLFESIGDLLDFLDCGVIVKTVNIGCLHYNGFNRKLMKNIAVSEEDIKNIKDIDSMGTVIEGRALPQSKKVDLMQIINDII